MGRIDSVYTIHRITSLADRWLTQRATMYNEFPGWAASDEIEFALLYFLPVAFNPPILLGDLTLISACVKPNFDEMQNFVALREGHWIGIEVICNATLMTCRVVVLQVPQRDQQFWTRLSLLDFDLSSSSTPIEPGRACVVGNYSVDGFMLIFTCRLIFKFLLCEIKSLRTSFRNPIKHGGLQEPFAANMRRLFLLVGGVHSIQPMPEVSLGGMNGDDKEEQPMMPQDPWQIDDPWKSSKKAVRQSKWEDLQLQSDHPFVDKSKSPLPLCRSSNCQLSRVELPSLRKDLCRAFET